MTCPRCHNPLFDARDDSNPSEMCIVCGYRTQNQEPEARHSVYRERRGADPDSPKRHQFPRTPEGVTQHRNALWRYRRKLRTAAMDLGETSPRLKGAR